MPSWLSRPARHVQSTPQAKQARARERMAVKVAATKALKQREREFMAEQNEAYGKTTKSQRERVWLRDAWGESPGAIAKAENLPTYRVKRILQMPDGEWALLRDQIRQGIVQRCYMQAMEMLDHITAQKAGRESNVQNATTAAILIDKARLLEGLPTSIVADVEVDVAKLMQPALLARLIQERGGLRNLRPEHQALAERLGIGDEVIDLTPQPSGAAPKGEEVAE